MKHCVNGLFRYAKLGSIFLVLSFAPTRAKSQCSQQPPNGSYSVPPNSTVYYQLDPSLNNIPPGNDTPSAVDEIKAAFDAWSTANTSSGGSGTKFALADANHLATVTVSADSSQGNGGATTTAAAGLISPQNKATIVFHPQANLTGSSVSAFQVTQPGYNTGYLQAALHEVGHLMGLDDYANGQDPPPGAETSVLIPDHGVNDQGNAYPKTKPTGCDVAQAAAVTQALMQQQLPSGGGGGGNKNPHTVPVASPPPGDGGGGGTGAGGCYTDSYQDPDSGNIYVYHTCY